jgi:hypothetical protein
MAAGSERVKLQLLGDVFWTAALAFYSEIDCMFIPYIRLDQRMPLWWWGSFTSEVSSCVSRLAARLKFPSR